MSPLEKLKADLATLDEKLADLHPTFDADDFKAATLERQTCSRSRCDWKQRK